MSIKVKKVGEEALAEIETGEAKVTAKSGKNKLTAKQAMDRSDASLGFHADFDATSVDIKSSIKKGFDATITRKLNGMEVSVTCSQLKTGDVQLSIPMEMRLASASVLHEVAGSLTYSYEKARFSGKIADSFKVAPMKVTCEFAYEDGEPSFEVTGESKKFDFLLQESVEKAVRACTVKGRLFGVGIETTETQGKITDCNIGAIVGYNGFRVGLLRDWFGQKWVTRTEFGAVTKWGEFLVGGEFSNKKGERKCAGGILARKNGFEIQVLSQTNESLFARFSGPLGNGVGFTMGVGVDTDMTKHFGLSVSFSD